MRRLSRLGRTWARPLRRPQDLLAARSLLLRRQRRMLLLVAPRLSRGRALLLLLFSRPLSLLAAALQQQEHLLARRRLRLVLLLLMLLRLPLQRHPGSLLVQLEGLLPLQQEQLPLLLYPLLLRPLLLLLSERAQPRRQWRLLSPLLPRSHRRLRHHSRLLEQSPHRSPCSQRCEKAPRPASCSPNNDLGRGLYRSSARTMLTMLTAKTILISVSNRPLAIHIVVSFRASESQKPTECLQSTSSCEAASAPSK